MTADDALTRLLALADPEAAKSAARFFKSGADGLPDGDRFIGVSAAPLRKLARDLRGLPMDQTERLLQSEIHEARSLALAVMVEAFAKANDATRKRLYDFYLANTRYVNAWDLVDLSARDLVGAYLAGRSRRPLYRLAKSPSLWERRIAIVATHHFIRANDFTDTLAIAELLLNDREDLIHKAVGWMLREAGKRDRPVLEGFLRKHHAAMPRTALRYAIERFPEPERRAYLHGTIS
jgi:3-methyladenine DNA glycosylase AlkD